MEMEQTCYAPIVLFVYNRPWHTQQTVEALLKNDLASESFLYVFADGEKQNATLEQKANIAKVRDYIHSIAGFKEIYIEESSVNKGLANSVIKGVTKVVEKHGKAIVVEDDLITNRFFLRYMNDALGFYENDHRIFSIGAFNYGFSIPNNYKYDVYIVHRSESCGWGTWKNRWVNIDWNISDAKDFFLSKRKQRKFNRGGNDMSDMLLAQLNGKIDSWAIRWDYHMYKHDAYCLRPVFSLVENIGFDGSGIHSGDVAPLHYSASQYDEEEYGIKLIKNIRMNRRIARSFCLFWKGDPNSFPIKKRIKRGIKKCLRSLGCLCNKG